MQARDKVSWQLRKCVLACKRRVMRVQVAHAGNKRVLSMLVHVFATMHTWEVCAVACKLLEADRTRERQRKREMDMKQRFALRRASFWSVPRENGGEEEDGIVTISSVRSMHLALLRNRGGIDRCHRRGFQIPICFYFCFLIRKIFHYLKLWLLKLNYLLHDLQPFVPFEISTATIEPLYPDDC